MGLVNQEPAATREEHKGMSKEQISTKVHTGPHPAAEIFVDGMGTSCTPNGSPVYLQFLDKWELAVWADINKEDPPHRIDMTGAFESRRDNGNDTIRARS